jgi:hypothetical protein
MRPAKVKIVGKVHVCKYEPTGHPDLIDEETGEALSGAILHDKQRIAVEEGQELEQEQDTIIHEIFHGIERAMDCQVEETVIRRLATGWLAVIKDNPSLIAYLKKKNAKPRTPAGALPGGA